MNEEQKMLIDALDAYEQEVSTGLSQRRMLVFTDKCLDCPEVIIPLDESDIDGLINYFLLY